jgi:D-amino peptidase
MRIFLITDMEGVAGVIDHDNWVVPSSRNYDEGRRLLTLEVTAAAEGLFAAGATEVLVADGHGAGGINQAYLDRRTLLQRGFPGPYPFGLERGYDAMAWVGQHAKAGTPFAHIAHTGWFDRLDERINGVSVGEFGELAYCGVALGVPAVFASGDEAFTREASALVPGIETVAVKRGLTPGSGDEYDTEGYRGRNLAAVHLHPERARELIRAGAERALRRLTSSRREFPLAKLEAPYRREVSYRPDRGTPAHRGVAEHATDFIAMMNGPERRV